VVGLWKVDPAKGAKRLAALLEEVYKRDRLPDLDKTLGWDPEGDRGGDEGPRSRPVG
jgi:hypothetical protein